MKPRSHGSSIAALAGALILSLMPAAHAFDLGDLGNLGGLLNNRQLEGLIKNTVDFGDEIDEDRETEIGRGMSADLLGAAPLLRNDKAQHYVNAVGRWVALQSERPDLSWRFGILDTDSINAFAAPGGYIFITQGLLDVLESEAELAGVLAHEIAHVTEKHYLQAIRRVAGANILGDALSLAANDSRHQAALDNVISAGTEVYARGLDKGDEFEADRRGVVLAARAGYDPYGLPALLQRLAAMNPNDSALSMLFKTHPPFSERLEMVIASMGEEMGPYARQPQLSPRFRKETGRSG